MINALQSGSYQLIVLALVSMGISLLAGVSGYSQNPSVPSVQDGIKVTFFGTSTLLIDDGVDQVLIDGFFSRPIVGPLLLTKVGTDKKLVDDILRDYRVDRLKAVFVSHSHYDHALDSAYIAKKYGAKLYGSESTLNIGRGGDVPKVNLELFKSGVDVAFSRFSVAAIHSRHGKVPFYRNDLGDEIKKSLKQPSRARKYREGGSFDFVIKYNQHVIYIKPSTEYLKNGLRAIPHADVLFLGTGKLDARGKKWKAIYYNEVVSRLNPHTVIPIHWDAFWKPFSKKLDEAPLSGNGYIRKKIEESGCRKFMVLNGGGSTLLFTKVDENLASPCRLPARGSD